MMHSPALHDTSSLVPDPTTLAVWRAELAVTRQSPWLASLFMANLDEAGRQLGALAEWFAALPRHLRRRLSRTWGSALVAAALVTALASGAAIAKMNATITVGAGGCTLAAAITAANTDAVAGSCPAGSGADTIDFANANGSYGYTAALPAITTAITIQGNSNTTIQRTGGPAFSVLRVTGGGSLALQNATITGGSASLGGGIYAPFGTVSLTSATISGNSAFRGGGIWAYLGTVSLTSATISGNSASNGGGGIYARHGTTNLTSATISGNSAGSGRGGGIYAQSSTVSLTSATISVNSAGDGGGILAVNSTVSLTSATISGNSAGSGRGGGIYASYSTVSLTSATISGNSATNSQGRGGGIYAQSSTTNLTSATISGNSATYRGGGIFARYGTTNLTSATISGNSASNSVGRGGGIYAQSSTTNLTSATISGNSAGYGGGIYAQSSTVSLTSATISGNSATYRGGGIFARYGTTNLTNATISGNSAGNLGGGIYIGASVVNLTHATISGNSAGSGGGIFVTVYSNMRVTSSIVAHQTAGADCAGTSSPVSGGYNVESATSCGFTGTGDQQSVTTGALNLGPLALNPPGTTETRALGTGSVALDQIPGGTNGCGTTITADQRGVLRPQNGDCEVGAYELLVAPGDCNTDYVINAGDLSALVLEIFDGDGTLPASVPGGTFPGDPVGCNPNGDGAVNAGDLSCAVLLIFNGPGACSP